MDSRMLEHIGHACRTARRHHGLRMLDIATVAGTSDATISRFERGLTWPLAPNVDDLIDAYARELNYDPIELWTAALTAWLEHSALPHARPFRRHPGDDPVADGP